MKKILPSGKLSNILRFIQLFNRSLPRDHAVSSSFMLFGHPCNAVSVRLSQNPFPSIEYVHLSCPVPVFSLSPHARATTLDGFHLRRTPGNPMPLLGQFTDIKVLTLACFNGS